MMETTLRVGDIITSSDIETLRKLVATYEAQIETLRATVRKTLRPLADGVVMDQAKDYSYAEALHAYQRIICKLLETIS